MGTFNNREIATAIWILLFLALSARTAGVRSAAAGLVRSFCNRHILTSVVAMLVYTAGLVLFLRAVGIWTAELLKDTIIWYCFTAFVLMMSAVTEEGSILRKVVKETVKVLLIFEFLINEYTFSLAIELVLVPAITIIVTMDMLARREEKFAAVAKLTGTILALFGFFLIFNAVGRAIDGFAQLTTVDVFREVILAPTLSVLFLPFLYLSILYSSYEQLFVRQKIGPAKTDREIAAIRRRLILHFGFNTAAIRRFYKAHAWDLTRVRTEAELRHVLAEWRAGNSTQIRESGWNSV
jgi:cytochrome c biogenesis protein CcdA